MDDFEKTIIEKMPEINVFPGWKTVRKIGEGSYGAVYRIERTIGDFTEVCALKEMRIPSGENEISALQTDGLTKADLTQLYRSYCASIEKEYSVMSKLKGHTNIVNCEDFHAEQQDNGFGWNIYIRMEFLTPMSDYLKGRFGENGPVPEDEVYHLAKDICQALTVCSHHNIIHRDIKPQNILVSPEGNYKLGDFGTARTVDGTAGLTAGIGTKNYMSPEVNYSQPYDCRADIYSFGLVLYWMLNEKRLPFLPLPPKTVLFSDNMDALQRRFAGDELPPPAHGSEHLKQIVLKACAYRPEDRFQTAQEMLDALNHSADSHPAEETRISAEEDQTLTEKTLTEEKKRSKALPFILAFLVLAAVIGLALPRLIHSPSSETTDQLQSVAPMEEDNAESEPVAELPETIKVTEEAATEEESAEDEAILFEEEPQAAVVLDYSAAQIGDVVPFGAYEQDNNLENGKESIRWTVLDRDETGLFLLSEYALDTQAFNKEFSTDVIPWSKSDICQWLNKDFLEITFSESERELIRPTMLSEDTYQNNKKKTAELEECNIFLLSVDEANNISHFPDEESRICYPTEYAKANGASVASNGATYWWLRSPSSETRYYHMRVYSNGRINSGGVQGTNWGNTIRPALWLSLDAYQKQVERAALKEQMSEYAEAEAGQYLFYGRYEQDNNLDNGPESIEWLVLNREDKLLTLISRDALDARIFQVKGKPATWDKSELRAWLNQTFLETAFSNLEQELIMMTQHPAEKNPSFPNNKAGEDTEDQVFLLGISEFNSYFKTLSGACNATEYAKANGGFTASGDNRTRWWLRTPGRTDEMAAAVGRLGALDEEGYLVAFGQTTVRPVIVIKLP